MPTSRTSWHYKNILAGAGLSLLLVGVADATPESRAAANFLLFSPSARAAGMGDAFVAIADGADATFFNPAALANDDQRSLTTTLYRPVPSLANDIYTSFIGYTSPIAGIGNFGLSLVYTSLGTQFRTDEVGNDLGTFTSFGVAFGVSYGAYLTKSLFLGITTKLIHQNLAGQGAGAEQGSGTGTSFAGDLGFLWKPGDRFSFGWALRNVGPNMTFIDADQSDPLPQTFTIGFGWEILRKENSSFLLVTDVYKPLADEGFLSFVTGWNDGSASEELKDLDYHVGGEWTYRISEVSDFAVRAGYSYDNDGNRKTPTFGLGLKYDWLELDLSYFANGGSAVRNVFRWTFGTTF